MNEEISFCFTQNPFISVPKYSGERYSFVLRSSLTIDDSMEQLPVDVFSRHVYDYLIT